MSSYDLSKLYISISHPEGIGFVESSADLNSFKEFREAGDDITKIAILSGDIDSPFSRIKDREQMITAIFEYLQNNDRELCHQIIKYENDLYLNAWIKYLFILSETEYTDWLLAKKDYEYFLLKSAKPQEENEPDDKYLKKRNDYRKTITELGQAVKSIEAKIFPDSKAAREAALQESKNRIKLYAEKHAVPFNYY